MLPPPSLIPWHMHLGSTDHTEARGTVSIHNVNPDPSLLALLQIYTSRTWVYASQTFNIFKSLERKPLKQKRWQQSAREKVTENDSEQTANEDTFQV